jgi:hypothetical protein
VGDAVAAASDGVAAVALPVATAGCDVPVVVARGTAVSACDPVGVVGAGVALAASAAGVTLAALDRRHAALESLITA